MNDRPIKALLIEDAPEYAHLTSAGISFYRRNNVV